MYVKGASDTMADTIELEIITTQDMLDELVGWWEAANEDEYEFPEYWDIQDLFEGADTAYLRETLLASPSPDYRAAAAAALGAMLVTSALPELVQARHDANPDVRTFANWAVNILDEWAACYNVWDFLIAAARLAMTTPRQLRMF